MPYIPRDQRAAINNRLADVLGIVRDLSAGELNYLITTVLRAWTNDLTYGRLNEAVGVLECVKLELYRRVAAPYEEKKRAENGDVYSDAGPRPACACGPSRICAYHYDKGAPHA